jgi:hypothetical protein
MRERSSWQVANDFEGMIVFQTRERLAYSTLLMLEPE